MTICESLPPKHYLKFIFKTICFIINVDRMCIHLIFLSNKNLIKHSLLFFFLARHRSLLIGGNFRDIFIVWLFLSRTKLRNSNKIVQGRRD